MPKLLSLGNGNILVMLDKYAQLKDFFFPYVGLENQIGHHTHRIGIYVDGTLHWTSDPAWEISIDSGDETLSGHIHGTNRQLQVSIHLHIIVYNEKNIYINKISIENHADRTRDIKIFFGHQFELYESHRGDTAYYDPITKTMIHYKGRRVFLINAFADGRTFDDYTVGLYGIEGKEGSHVDAYDGTLSKNTIEHGTVDSVIGMNFSIPAGQQQMMHYWITVAKSLQEAHALNSYVLDRTPEHLIKTTQDFWYAWVNKENFSFHGLDPDIAELFKKSLFMIRSHIDNGGAVLASGDSDLLQQGRDYYSYVWPRDGAFITMAMDYAGYRNIAQKFFEFCNDIITDDGYLMHKYRPDKSLGSSWHPWMRDGHITFPIQEDETALTIYALWKHYEISKDIEFIEDIYNSLIKKAADFMVKYIDPATGLPLPSYDLWEEKYGTSTFTCSSVYAALLAAGRFANILGKVESERIYNMTAQKIKQAILDNLYDPVEHIFYKRITYNGNIAVIDRTVDMSSCFGAFMFDIMDIDDDRLAKAMEKAKQTLTCNTPIGGLARYEGDWYYRASESVPGNPWIITTLWLARYYIARAKKEEDFKPVKEILSWVSKQALSSGILPEQINPYTREPISATPLTWSHAEFVTTIMKYMERLKALGISEISQPL